jgi:hypothetical protein
MQKSRRDYLITQIQQNVFDIASGVNTGQFKLDFVNPVKELYFVIQRQGSVGTDEFEFVTPFDYDGILEETGNKYILWENLGSSHTYSRWSGNHYQGHWDYDFS